MSEITFPHFFNRLPEFTGSSITMSGLFGSADAYFLAQLCDRKYSMLCVADSDDQAEDLFSNINTLGSLIHAQGFCPSYLYLADDVESRIATLGKLVCNRGGPSFLVASRDALTMPASTYEFITKSSIHCAAGKQLNRTVLLSILEQGRYERDDFVEQPGQYAVRGEVIDLWMPGSSDPVRLVNPLDAVESIRRFDVDTQRSFNRLDALTIYPAQLEETSSLISLYEQLDATCSVVYGHQQSIQDIPNAKNRTRIMVTNPEDAQFVFTTHAVPDFQKNFTLLGRQLSEWEKQDIEVNIFSHNTGERDRLKELLYEHCREYEAYPTHHIGMLTRGFVAPDEGIACVANGDVFGRYHKTFKMPRSFGGRVLHSLGDIKPADYVVHEKYGIGIYRGLQEIEAFGHSAEFIKLGYKNNDFLYVPVEDFQKVQKYIGSEGRRPRLYSLDGVAWENMKKKVSKGVMELAQELIKINAQRMAQSGFSFSHPTHMEREFAESFMYPETPDQARTIEEVLADMQSTRPMDRLLCGDVGFGKTEVAMRAAFKAVSDSAQVAVLVPTTILA
ncbi:MAG: hypothetical protein GF384_03440, partial [Elusimicrobia bacterium]|nr:hypothetical protein [Elusimicrobiota bacterium]MBD3411968.1 hypothetical protein [Elusimicrobiota bacterium]